MEELYQVGRIKAIGISNFHPDRVMDFIIDYTPAPSEHEWVQGEAWRNDPAIGLFVIVEIWPLATTTRAQGPGQEETESHWHIDEMRYPPMRQETQRTAGARRSG